MTGAPESIKTDLLLLVRRNQLLWILIVGLGMPVGIGYVVTGNVTWQPVIFGLLLTIVGIALDLVIAIQNSRDELQAEIAHQREDLTTQIGRSQGEAISSVRLVEGELRKLLETQWVPRNACDETLIQVRPLTSELSRSDNRVMAEFFKKGLLALDDEIREALGAGQYSKTQTADTRKWLLAFAEGSIIRLTHSVLDNSRVFGGNEGWKSFHRELGLRVADGRLAGVRRLFILENESDCIDPVIKAQIAHHARTSGFDYRLLMRSQVESIRKHFEMSEHDCDFGIYSGYVYQWLCASEEREAGLFIFDSKRVKRYHEMYDSMWDAGATKLVGVQTREKI